MLMRSVLLIRTMGLLLPLLAACALWLWRLPSRRTRAGILLAFAWNLSALLAINLLAAHFGWWRFYAQGGLLLGIPADLYIGWAVLWGAIPVLAFPRMRLLFLIALMLGVDLLLMPACAPVIQLGNRWLVGEAMALAIVLLPAQALARWTKTDSRLKWRASLQALIFSGLLLGVLPAVILEQTGGSWLTFWNRSFWLKSIYLQLLMIPATLGLTALQEFVERGRGTPIPYDPPRRLVTSGVYAYIANPMQLSICLLLAVWGLLLSSYWVAGASLMGLVYGAGLAAWDEGGDLRRRHGRAWVAYRQMVRNWWPRWRPWYSEDARVYVAEGCEPCSEVGTWLKHRRPVALKIIAAEKHPTLDLRRMTYEASDGTIEEGVAAFARSLEHINLAWGFAGWTMRLPLVRQLIQLLVDAVGGGPREVRRFGCETISVAKIVK